VIVEFMLIIVMKGNPKVPVLLSGFESKAACEREGKIIMSELVLMDSFATGQFRCRQINKK
jgi:hypothetical protein